MHTITMKPIKFLTHTASLALVTFLALLALGHVSVPAFWVAVFAWISLVAVNAYTPRRGLAVPKLRATPRFAAVEGKKASYPLAA